MILLIDVDIDVDIDIREINHFSYSGTVINFIHILRTIQDSYKPFGTPQLVIYSHRLDLMEKFLCTMVRVQI